MIWDARDWRKGLWLIVLVAASLVIAVDGKSIIGVKVIIPPNSSGDRVTVAEQQNVILKCLLPINPRYWWKCILGHCKKLSDAREPHTIYSVKQSDAGNYFCGGEDKSSWSEAVEVVVNPGLYETVTPPTSSNTVASLITVPNPTEPQQWTSTKSKTGPTAQGTDLSTHITNNHQQTALVSIAGNRRQKSQSMSAKSPVATASKRSNLSVTDGEQPKSEEPQDDSQLLIIVIISTTVTILFVGTTILCVLAWRRRLKVSSEA